MSTNNASKINQLLQAIPPGIVLLSSWLNRIGYSFDLQKRYRKSNWLKSIGTGAMKRTGDDVTYLGALFALQNQADFSIHPGGKTALSILGKSQYLTFSDDLIYLFGVEGEKLPKWFLNQKWDGVISYNSSSFLPTDLDLRNYEYKNFTIKISGATRAFLECLFLADHKNDLIECYEIMEGLNSLRPDVVQELLQNCTSVKVKRLFLYMAEKAGHQWYEYLDISKIDLGKGKRSISPGGVFNPNYQITIPKELDNYV